MVSTPVASALAVLCLLLVPFLWNDFVAYQLGLYLLYGMVGQGIALCWGRTGFLPLGQALFFGIGAYLSGYALLGSPNWLMVAGGFASAIIVPACLAWIVGSLVFDRQVGSGPYFSLITLALSMLGFQLANSMDWLTGGFNGLTGVSGLPGIDSYSGLYYVIVAALALTTFVVGHVFRLPFGRLLEGVRENEDRLQLFGFRTSRLKALAFGLSAALAGLAGALFAPLQGIVTPQSVGFELSANLVIWTAVGGRFGLLAPIVGSVLIGFLASGLRDSFRYWEVVVALVFIVVVLKLPGGLGGLAQMMFGRLRLPFIDKKPIRRSIEIEPPASRDKPDLLFDDVAVQVGLVSILKGLSFVINRPGIHCIIGPNGAGKTSTFNVMTGKLPAVAGRITWRGRPLQNGRPFAAAALGVGRKLQVPSIFTAMTIGQNLDIALWANRLRAADMFSYAPCRWTTKSLECQLSHFPFLAAEDMQAGRLSVGQRQMLDFAMTMLADPALVLLDEPCAGLSTTETEKMIDVIATMAAETDAVFVIIEHDMQVVERLSDHVLVLHQGALLASGTMQEIKSNAAVRQVYAGGTK
jgi:branched-chain amino acid transport system permease protein